MLVIPKVKPDQDDDTESTIRVEPDDPAASAVHAALASGLHWLRVNQPSAIGGDVEGVHHLRVTTRRLRSALSTFGGLLDSAWADRLALELKLLGKKLGDVRDLDVLRARFSFHADATGTADNLAPLFSEIDRRHATASGALCEEIQGERFKSLLNVLEEGLTSLPLTDDAWQPCRDALPPLVEGTWKILRRQARALTPADPDADFHRVRKQSKRARYATETVKDALDPASASDAARFAKNARKVQDVLGLHQDAIVAANLIRQAARDHPDLGPFNFAAGQILERETREAVEARARFFEVWLELDRKKNLRWLKP